MPSLCNLCEAAVLVLTANITRREAAIKAKEQLLRQGVTLLGTVLDQRTMPIAESIYRRL
jgi:Mrp family chromosome partitioning ATPase